MKTKAENPELYELSRPIPKKLIEKPPPGRYGDYVPHFVITQMLLATVGPFDWELVSIIEGDMQEVKKRDGTTIEGGRGIVGAVYRLTVIIDGVQVMVEEVGSVHQPAMEPSDADRLKKASSDCIKRCAMRLGLGIQLWCKTATQFSLPRVLAAGSEEQETAEVAIPDEPEKDE